MHYLLLVVWNNDFWLDTAWWQSLYEMSVTDYGFFRKWILLFLISNINTDYMSRDLILTLQVRGRVDENEQMRVWTPSVYLHYSLCLSGVMVKQAKASTCFIIPLSFGCVNRDTWPINTVITLQRMLYSNTSHVLLSPWQANGSLLTHW